MNELLKYIYIYLDLGWYVFPCREMPGHPYEDKGKIKIPKEKTPYTRNGFKDASNNGYQIERWWKLYPKACIAISCEHSGLFLIDIDVKNGRKGIDNYMQLGISDTGALHSRTPSKGLHVLFTGKGKSSTNVETGIDTRGDGGYFIAPPSEVLKGTTIGRYIFLDNWDHNPVVIDSSIIEKLHVDSNKKNNRKKHIFVSDQLSTDENVKKAKEALEKLPMRMCDNYQEWIEIGLSLYDLGEDGLKLWIDWSKKSDRYQEGICEEKWDTFKPDEISLGSLFYYSKESNL
jgi:hypothetical protein